MSPELMFWLMLATKMAVTAVFVTIATTIAERLGAMTGALVATLPVSAGPVYVFWRSSRSLFHFFKRACQSRTQRRYRDLCYGLRSDRTTTLNVVQRISRICNMARGCFFAQSCSLERLVGIHSQLCCFRRLCLHRPAILPGAHATDDTALV